MENIRNIIESLLFAADDPLTVDKLKYILETVDAKEIRANLNALADQYEARGGGFRLTEVAGGWQLRSRPEYHDYIRRMLQPSPQRLSRATMETLAIVAYNQPIIRADIEHIRGVDCGGILRQLLERKLIRVLGRKEIPGRPLIYATSKLFLELFELKNLKDLPTPKEIEEITAPQGHSNQMPGPEESFLSQTMPMDSITSSGTTNTQQMATHQERPSAAGKTCTGGNGSYAPGIHRQGSTHRSTGIGSGQHSIASSPHKIGSKPAGLTIADANVAGKRPPSFTTPSKVKPAAAPINKEKAHGTAADGIKQKNH